MDYENYIADRLTQLRLQAGVSARDMSLSIGQSPGYINKIESHQNLPSLQGFFAICEYLDISPRDFFEEHNQAPHKASELVTKIKHLSERQLDALNHLVDTMKTP